MTNPVFIQEDEALSHLVKDDIFILSAPESHHAVAVMRLKNGDFIDVVNGKGTRIEAVIVQADKTKVECKVEDKNFEARKKHLHLIQALAKGGRDEQAVESCVELGVSSVTPWKASRCVSVWDGKKHQKALVKWKSLVFAATKQSRQSNLALVNPMLDSKNLAKFIERKTNEGAIFVVLHESATGFLSDMPNEILDKAEDIYMLVGPEGGISDEEIELFVSKGAIKMRLTDTILRTSNAGNVALTMIGTKIKLWSET